MILEPLLLGAVRDMTTRTASHAGSWYTGDGQVLSEELEGWLNDVNSQIEDVGKIPLAGARVIIAPYVSQQRPTAAWAYQALDVSQAKRVFLLGPSHHKYLTGCALSKHATYASPVGNLPLDKDTITALKSKGRLDDMSTGTDEAEHSLEMHIPYIYHMLSKKFDPAHLPPLVPILVGNTNPNTEKAFGSLLAPYLADPANIFVISSDFCHWGSRFGYTYYVPRSSTQVRDGHELSKRDSPSDPPINESIGRIDKAAMEAIESGSHDAFLANLHDTGNTVCGRHPIGIVMAAIDSLRQEAKLTEDQGFFQFVRYERSSEVKEARDSSVSYGSAFAVM
ncbi:uncharacterized protein KY384_001845 [Bacidia gigantensis]|uniref:uncharacterized protein n=1 Tax=Bacidia gigantensis TaxID=2732470 RepID=UPI001D046A89|nr:uncharacterized protein KY384_001845 [Bacidia gigantensis]KAG8533062.1 hypothetical protein KY384_001845 [Bacidia gigantensis]